MAWQETRSNKQINDSNAAASFCPLWPRKPKLKHSEIVYDWTMEIVSSRIHKAAIAHRSDCSKNNNRRRCHRWPHSTECLNTRFEARRTSITAKRKMLEFECIKCQIQMLAQQSVRLNTRCAPLPLYDVRYVYVWVGVWIFCIHNFASLVLSAAYTRLRYFNYKILMVRRRLGIFSL